MPGVRLLRFPPVCGMRVVCWGDNDLLRPMHQKGLSPRCLLASRIHAGCELTERWFTGAKHTWSG